MQARDVMSEVVRSSSEEIVKTKRPSLWPMALVILAIVFGPALVAWGISLFAG
jgi:TRAP-type C4-dicarboxylate transport system permease large subunit